MSTGPDEPVSANPSIRSPDMLYSAGLAAAAALLLTALVLRDGFLTAGHGPGTALFFFVFGLYTITVGFPHPGFGHVSFDRVGQVAAILVLGPLDAAVICGVASLVYPWKRLREGQSPGLVVMASLHNAGLMSLVVLAGGTLYQTIGGPVPLTGLTLETAAYLLALVVTVQLLNDFGMLVIFRLRGENPAGLVTAFTTTVEMVSALIAILVALVMALGEPGITVLLLVVLSLGMLVLKRYAEMRSRLEMIVVERTAELQAKTLELEHQATRDKLTGLFNRHYMDEFLERQLRLSRRGQQPLTIALADIDHFKEINDRYSHAAGDRVLARVAEMLSTSGRQSDVVARYGGEEFLLCFPGANLRFAERICGDLRRAIETTDWSEVVAPQGPRRDVRITMSFGIAEARADSTVGSFLDEADVRLYRAKNAGRNRVVA